MPCNLGGLQDIFYILIKKLSFTESSLCFHRKGKISATVVTSDGPQEREEVFYTIPLQGRRRHSVGGYLTTGAAGAGEVTTVPSEVPRMPPPRFNQKEEDTIKRRKPKNFSFKGKRVTFQKELFVLKYIITLITK